MIPFDLHTHCTLSFDGQSTAEEMVCAAISLGTEHYALTDHIDLGSHPDPDFDLEATVNGAKQLIPELQKRYSGSIDLLYGVELGQAVHDKQLADKLLSENDYDFVIGSLHNIRGYDDFYFLDFTKLDAAELLDRYFDELYETAEYGRFDVMGHITYPLRYMVGEYGITVDMTRFAGRLDDIFSLLIRNGCGIEINTSGLRQKYGRMFPEADMVRRYRELGGEILTIGSDAHNTADIGKGITEGIAAAKEAGFSEIAIFRNRKPTFIKI